MAFDSSTSLATRLKRAAAFTAIVWAVAASFVAFDILALAGFDRMLETSLMRGLALPAAVRNSTTCTQPAAAVDRALGHQANDTSASIWLLGVTAGVHARNSPWAVAGSTRGDGERSAERRPAHDRSAQAARAVDELATRLRVPIPVPVRPQGSVDPNTAFTFSVESDPDGTARGIAENYTEAACHLYKAGAYWGYAMEVRMALPGTLSGFGSEIEYHARRANLPEELWSPALAVTPSNARREDLVEEARGLTEGITQHLTTGR